MAKRWHDNVPLNDEQGLIFFHVVHYVQEHTYLISLYILTGNFCHKLKKYCAYQTIATGLLLFCWLMLTCQASGNKC